MNISKTRLIWEAVKGAVNPWGSAFGNIVDYLLGLLNGALAKIKDGDKQKVQAALNIALKVLATLKAVKWLCPTKWQTAYGETIEALEAVVESLPDLELLPEELERIGKEFKEAVEAWKSPDDETCVAAEALK